MWDYFCVEIEIESEIGTRARGKAALIMKGNARIMPIVRMRSDMTRKYRTHTPCNCALTCIRHTCIRSTLAELYVLLIVLHERMHAESAVGARRVTSRASGLRLSAQAI